MARKVLVNDVVKATSPFITAHRAEARAHLNQFHLQPFITKQALVGGDI